MSNFSRTALIILFLFAALCAAFGQSETENNITLRASAGDTLVLVGFYPQQVETTTAKAGSTRAFVEISTIVYGGSGNETQKMVGEILRPKIDRTESGYLISSQGERLVRVTTQHGTNCRWEQKVRVIAPEGVTVLLL
jgi:hypothetical protein